MSLGTPAAENRLSGLVNSSARNAAAVEYVRGLISAVPAADVKAEDKAIISAARRAYDALTVSQKRLVSNYARLTNAEEELAELEKAGSGGCGSAAAGAEGVLFGVILAGAAIAAVLALKKKRAGVR